MRTDEAAKGTGPREGKHTCVRCGQVHMVSATFLGLGRGSSSQYSVYTGCVSYTRLGTVHYFGEAKTGRGQAATPAPPAGERDSSEAPPEGPAGGALPEVRFYAICLHWSKKIQKYVPRLGHVSKSSSLGGRKNENKRT